MPTNELEMKQDKKYWIDESGNKWTKTRYTQDQARAFSKTLVDCVGCIDCSDCSSCSDCSYFKDNPQRITSHCMGSECRQTTVYWNKEYEQVVCGCFRGTLDDLKAKVDQVHGRNKHGIAYSKWIKAVKAYIKVVDHAK